MARQTVSYTCTTGEAKTRIGLSQNVAVEWFTLLLQGSSFGPKHSCSKYEIFILFFITPSRYMLDPVLKNRPLSLASASASASTSAHYIIHDFIPFQAVLPRGVV
jgi:hypothetical protein